MTWQLYWVEKNSILSLKLTVYENPQKTYFASWVVIFEGFVVKMMPRCPAAGWDYDHIPIQSQRTHVCMRFLNSLLTFYSIIFEASTELCLICLCYTLSTMDRKSSRYASKTAMVKGFATGCLLSLTNAWDLISYILILVHHIMEQIILNLESRTFKTRQSVA